MIRKLIAAAICFAAAALVVGTLVRVLNLPLWAVAILGILTAAYVRIIWLAINPGAGEPRR